MTRALLSLQNVSKRFQIASSGKVVRAVNNVSFDIKVGQTVGLVGESGSGKTTVGRCIMGLSGSFDGVISFQGTHLGAKPTASTLGQLQVVFQEPYEQLDPRMKIHQSIEEPLRALGLSRDEKSRRVADSLNLVGLDPAVANLIPAQLSAGQQQRVGIARAMITEPRLVILDEPTSALDPSARAEIIALLRRIQVERGTAYLFISHDLSTVRYLADRVAVMYLGMIVEEGPTEEVFSNPRHPYSQALLGSVLLPNPNYPPATDVQLAGEIPSPLNLPEGCFLASRCPFAQEACRAAMPPVNIVGEEHFVRCIRSNDDEVVRSSRSDSYERFQFDTEAILSVGAPTHRRVDQHAEA
ncbi:MULTISPECIES: ABC transporter ATP-binding protein [Agrobacterium]|uniref:ABC transporter ATP-binding protein n=1 Tax=Agrobacterium rubi TaxID=28099 RepID=A0AAE7RFU7_9HYPH|nr:MULTISPECIES: ABC transporter ATP-binding protein [Agrobacterium]MBN7809210.1 ABC transporter ATP-binding protein [Agrobacterium rosae]NTE89848.1 ABC transporter ATP-binding protein [Agrobacterium rubi]NTF05302.1 ABC transporter ATP-binding protein [Agrobacterium rubi]NTF39746.1 ABC transporter ATP-binding protein [Agrobacterium rubi]OCJ44937.1 hypothetical protein A6U92_17105 [Agrobacterium rubi]